MASSSTGVEPSRSGAAPSWTCPRRRRRRSPTRSGRSSTGQASSQRSVTTNCSTRTCTTRRSAGVRSDDPGHGGQAAPRSSEPGVQGLPQSALERWEPAVIDPICDELVDGIKNDGAADLVKAITFEFPTRVTATLLGLPQEDLDLFRRLSLDLISIEVDIEAGLTASVELAPTSRRRSTADAARRPTTSSVIWSLPRSTARS